MSVIPARGFLWDSLSLSDIDGLRYCAGIPIPNYHFNEVNSNIWAGSKEMEDGETVSLSRFHHWYYNGFLPGSSWGSNSGAKVGSGIFDTTSLYFKATGTSATLDPANHAMLDACIFTEFIDFYHLFRAHYAKALTLHIAMKHGAGSAAYGTTFRCFVAQYDSTYSYIAYDEFIFQSVPAVGAWGMVEAKTITQMSANTRYIQLYICLDQAATGVDQPADINRVSLGVNPLNDDEADGSDPELYVDLQGYLMAGLPTSPLSAPGVHDLRMGDGSSERVSSMAGMKARVATSWYREDVDVTRAMQLLWGLGTTSPAFGEYVPHPVPILIDFGLGGPAPRWSYYRPKGSTFQVGYNPNWLIGSEGYDFGMEFEEV